MKMRLSLRLLALPRQIKKALKLKAAFSDMLDQMQ